MNALQDGRQSTAGQEQEDNRGKKSGKRKIEVGGSKSRPCNVNQKRKELWQMTLDLVEGGNQMVEEQKQK